MATQVQRCAHDDGAGRREVPLPSSTSSGTASSSRSSPGSGAFSVTAMWPGIGQALEELKLEVAFHRPQNEQGMVHAAIAYAKMKNRLQTFACTSSIGPGATNMITGAATATVNRLPVLLLPGDIFASRRPDPVLQQLEYPLSMDVSVNDAFIPVSRYWDRINRPEQILASLPEAMRVLTDQAETGAVTICLPQDVQAEALRLSGELLREAGLPHPARRSASRGAAARGGADRQRRRSR